MRWIEVSIDTPQEEIDIRCEQLSAMGANGFVIENEADFRNFLETNRQYWDYVDTELEQRFAGVSRIKFYLQDDLNGNSALADIKARWPEALTAFIEDSDWENNWKEYYHPIEIGEKLVVVPEWEEIPEGGRSPLILDPGLIFGTGSHATTRMCLTALEQYAAGGKTVLDLGCGSGILGIGAVILGCSSSTGCDIDSKAPDVAAANAALNGIGSDRFTVYAGDILSDAGMKRRLGSGYDIVLANIVSDVIIPLSAMVCGFMKDQGVFICSGIIEGRQNDVRAAIEANGLEIIRALNEEEWHCFVCRKA